MKLFFYLIILLCTGMSFSSCQKEFTIEATTAKGSLQKDSAGECMPSLVNGVYAKDSLLKASNFVDITVKITQTGTYSINTDTVNGYSFSAAGEVGIIGLNTIRLVGKGRPILGGIDIFKIKFDSSICEFNVIVSGPGGSTSAVFTLAGSPSACTGSTQTPNFYASVPATSANTVTVFANVTVPGAYTITALTTPANGLTFSGTGTLAVGNNQPITLIANGTPSTAGSIPYSLSTTSPSSNCGFNLTVQGATTPTTDSIVAFIDNIYTTFNFRDSAKRTMTSGYDAIGILGYNNAAGFESFGFLVGTMAPLGPGTYTVNQFPAVIVAAQDTSATFAYSAQTNPIGAPQIPGFTVTITTLNATNVSGTFSGRLFDNMGAGPGFRNITGGKFSVTIYP